MQETPNLNYIKELAGDDYVFEQEFIGILKNEFPKEQAIYITSINEGRLSETAEIVHKLKHKLNILSMTESYGYAITYEEELRDQHAKLDAGFRKILETIENYLKTI